MYSEDLIERVVWLVLTGRKPEIVANLLDLNVHVTHKVGFSRLQKLGLTRKRLSLLAREQKVEDQAVFVAEVAGIPVECFVWADEVRADRRTLNRPFGRAMRERARRCHYVRGKRYSTIGSSAGLVLFGLVVQRWNLRALHSARPDVWR